jgi:hypothetical protein
MKNIFKELFIPSGEKTTVIAYNSWVVRWYKLSTYEYSTIKGQFGFTSAPECEIFPSEIDAEKFAEQLREAFKFLRITGDFSKVKVEANQSKLATITE